VEDVIKKENWVTGREIDPESYRVKEERIMTEAKGAIKSELTQNFQNKLIEEFKRRFTKDEKGNPINFNIKT
jgi:hypothetical protein